jgi:hypothetical protein
MLFINKRRDYWCIHSLYSCQCSIY